MLLHLTNATYYGLDPVGTRIRELLKEGPTTDGIRARLVAEYDVAEDVVAADMEWLLNDLLAHGIITAGPA